MPCKLKSYDKAYVSEINDLPLAFVAIFYITSCYVDHIILEPNWNIIISSHIEMIDYKSFSRMPPITQVCNDLPSSITGEDGKIPSAGNALCITSICEIY